MNHEHLTDTLVLFDVDGTTSNTAQHMQGFNRRLAEAFPHIGEMLPTIRQKRAAFRREHGHLSFTQQDILWQRQYPGTTSHSQFDIYRTFAPEVFDDSTTAAVNEWLQEPTNFGHGEYDDVAFTMQALRRIGAMPALFTLGQHKTASGEPGWQELKLRSAPTLSVIPSHIAGALPAGGKGQVIAESYRANDNLFHFPTTDRSPSIQARNVILVDDSLDNLNLPPQAQGVYIDREQQARLAANSIAQIASLHELVDLVEAGSQPLQET